MMRYDTMAKGRERSSTWKRGCSFPLHDNSFKFHPTPIPLEAWSNPTIPSTPFSPDLSPAKVSFLWCFSDRSSTFPSLIRRTFSFLRQRKIVDAMAASSGSANGDYSGDKDKKGDKGNEGDKGNKGDKDPNDDSSVNRGNGSAPGRRNRSNTTADQTEDEAVFAAIMHGQAAWDAGWRPLPAVPRPLPAIPQPWIQRQTHGVWRGLPIRPPPSAGSTPAAVTPTAVPAAVPPTAPTPPSPTPSSPTTPRPRHRRTASQHTTPPGLAFLLDLTPRPPRTRPASSPLRQQWNASDEESDADHAGGNSGGDGKADHPADDAVTKDHRGS